MLKILTMGLALASVFAADDEIGESKSIPTSPSVRDSLKIPPEDLKNYATNVSIIFNRIDRLSEDELKEALKFYIDGYVEHRNLATYLFDELQKKDQKIESLRARLRNALR